MRQFYSGKIPLQSQQCCSSSLEDIWKVVLWMLFCTMLLMREKEDGFKFPCIDIKINKTNWRVSFFVSRPQTNRTLNLYPLIALSVYTD